jgi:hypothetical protein
VEVWKGCTVILYKSCVMLWIWDCVYQCLCHSCANYPCRFLKYDMFLMCSNIFLFSETRSEKRREDIHTSLLSCIVAVIVLLYVK